MTLEIPASINDSVGWQCHPSADIAVFALNWEELEKYDPDSGAFRAGVSTLTRKDVEEYNYLEGDDVFLIGFPEGWSPGKRDYPIVRNGCLAQIRGWLDGEHTSFLVDGSGFPGNSGGPVVTRSAISGYGDYSKQRSSYLIGMVSKRRRTEIVPSGIPEVFVGHFEETADLIEVVPMEQINATIEMVIEKFCGFSDQ